MSLEQEIIAIEESADAIVSAARAEAKRLMGTLDERRRAIREAAAARLEAEKARMGREHAAALRVSLEEIARGQKRAEAAVEKMRGGLIDACVRRIVGTLQEG
jgi:hypothetical protein